MTKGQFKNFAKAHILENMEKYKNLTMEFNIVGKIKIEADPMLIEKIKELKRMSHTRVLTGWQNPKNNSPIIKSGTSKFWVPTTSSGKFGIRLQKGTPSKVPSNLVTLQNARNHNLGEKLPGCLASKIIPRALSRLF